jgi:hypothetical protein
MSGAIVGFFAAFSFLPFSCGASGKVEFAIAAGSDFIRNPSIFHCATIIAKGATDIAPFDIAIDPGLPGIDVSKK